QSADRALSSGPVPIITWAAAPSPNTPVPTNASRMASKMRSSRGGTPEAVPVATSDPTAVNTARPIPPMAPDAASEPVQVKTAEPNDAVTEPDATSDPAPARTAEPV